MENEKLKKSIEILQRTVQSKNNEIDNKNNLLNKLLEGFKFNPLCPDPRDTALSEHVEDLDIDSLLQANLGEVNFNNILDLSGTRNLFQTELPYDVVDLNEVR